METKQISIPSFLHDIHGEKASLADLLFTYGGGLISMVTTFIIHAQSDLQLNWWKLLILCLVSADIGAGTVANFTRGTNLYYTGKNKKKTRIIFILIHFLHPAIFLYAIGSVSVFHVLLVVFVIFSSILINSLGSREKQGIIAAFLMITGISLLVLNPTFNPLLWWFFPLYMTKLFIAFSIRRY